MKNKIHLIKRSTKNKTRYIATKDTYSLQLDHLAIFFCGICNMNNLMSYPNIYRQIMQPLADTGSGEIHKFYKIETATLKKN